MEVRDKPNIVIVVMDCVRAQNLPVYGYGKPTAPRISELAAEGVRFDNMITVGEQTLSSTASFFTGTYPSTHGLRISGEKLDPRFVTLAEALAQNGYTTHCINCNNPYVSPYTDLHRGFMEYICAFPATRRWIGRLRGSRQGGNLAQIGEASTPVEHGDVVRDELKSTATVRASYGTAHGALVDRLRWELTRFVDGGAAMAMRCARRILQNGDPGRPKFIYVHLMETHSRYLPPLGHRRLFLPDLEGRNLMRINHDPLPFLTGAAPMDKLDFDIVEALYNGAIHYTDAMFGKFYDWLRRKGKVDNTIVVLTADHGENFGEHGLFGHGQCVYDTVVRVPLLIWGPVVNSRMRGSAVSSVVQNIDLTASCLEWAGNRVESIQGQVESSPLPLAVGAAPGREYAISESVHVFERSQVRLLKEMDLFRRGALGARTKEHKLIVHTAGQEEFYDLTRDPGETDNIINCQMDAEVRLRSVLEPLIAGFRYSHDVALMRLEEGGPVEADAKVEQRLRDLGYIE